MVKQLALPGDFQMAVATAHEPASEVKHHSRALFLERTHFSS